MCELALVYNIRILRDYSDEQYLYWLHKFSFIASKSSGGKTAKTANSWEGWDLKMCRLANIVFPRVSKSCFLSSAK